MRIALLQCPAWAVDRPPYALALISSLLRDHPEHDVVPFDFNIEMYRRAQDEGKHIRFTLAGAAEEKFGPDSWSAWAIEWDWGVQDHVLQFMRANEAYVDRCVDAVLATGAQAVGFSVHYTSKYFSLEFARRIKQRDPSRIIIFGGPQCFPTCDADHLMSSYDFIDVACLGECEGDLPALLDDLDRYGLERPEPYESYRGYQIRLRGRTNPLGLPGSPKGSGIVHRDNLTQPVPIDLNRLPVADWSWVDFSQYTRISIPVITSRGCIRRCNFCSEAGAKTTSWGAFRYRDAAKTMEEIRYQHERYRFDYLWFTDSVFNGNVRMVEELCDLLIDAQLDFFWDAQVTIRPDMTLELLRKFKRAGCQMLHWGVESGSDTVLKLMRKGYTAELARTVIERAHQADLRQNINLIVGYPGETEEHFQETLAFLEDIRPFGISNPPVAVCDINRGANLYYMVDDLDIEPAEYGQWYIRDGSNTPEIRLDRKRRMEEVLERLLAQTGYERKRHYDGPADTSVSAGLSQRGDS